MKLIFQLRYYILISLISIILQKSVVAESNKFYQVVQIIDGDTFVISYKGKREKVRLFGIDTPERNKKGYFKAAGVLEDLCFQKKVRLVFPYKNKRDRFGRLLAKVYLKNGRMVNQILLEKGVAKLYRKDPLIIKE